MSPSRAALRSVDVLQHIAGEHPHLIIVMEIQAQRDARTLDL